MLGKREMRRELSEERDEREEREERDEISAR